MKKKLIRAYFMRNFFAYKARTLAYMHNLITFKGFFSSSSEILRNTEFKVIYLCLSTFVLLESIFFPITVSNPREINRQTYFLFLYIFVVIVCLSINFILPWGHLISNLVQRGKINFCGIGRKVNKNGDIELYTS